ncbi:hypothetical protein GIS00_11645 [Nakamurella sp. YIM 132087]|uniref:DUF308 domain-containing protein n=1 Tax=Nakamurella alba TaxID=2665158 RepID=A0A7K1FKI1_9ACTN|nr:hypothetical protein [Nakamurella alba]MTD14596.1 hypothetical protein [Nakamurella alba]
MTVVDAPTPTSAARALRRLYVARAVVAAAWAAVVLVAAPTVGPLLTVLLALYPLIDAVAVFRQLRLGDQRQAAPTEWINVGVSVLVAVALGVASTVSIGAVLTVWGIWAIGSGVPQLITAIRRRAGGGQVAQMLSGGISVLAGGGFVVQGLQGADSLSGIGGYALLGAVFFLVSALLLGRPRRTT